MQNGGPVHGFLSAGHMGLNLANWNEGKHRNCNSQIRSIKVKSTIFTGFISLKFSAGDRDPGHIAMKLWMIALKFTNNFFSVSGKATISSPSIKDLIFKENECSNLVLNE